MALNILQQREKKKTTEIQKLLKINSKFWEVTTGREGLFGPPPSWTGYLYEGYAKKNSICHFALFVGHSQNRCFLVRRVA